MLRIILSIILGILFPIFCILILALITDYLPSYLFDDLEFYGESVPGIILIPFFFPFYTDILLRNLANLPLIFQNLWLRGLFIIVQVWGVYGVLAYFILGRFKRFKKQEKVVSNEPPPPSLYQ